MKKIVAVLLITQFFVILPEQDESYGLFENYFKFKPLWSNFTNSDKGARYVGSISDSKNPKMSPQGYFNYLKTRVFCEFGYEIAFVDQVENEHVFYACSRDENKVIDSVNLIKNNHLEAMKKTGDDLKKSKIVYFSDIQDLPTDMSGKEINTPCKDGKLHVFVHSVDLDNSPVDSIKFYYEVKKKVDQAQYGLHIIDGKLVKIVSFKHENNLICLSNVIIKPEEIAEAKLKLPKSTISK